MTQGWCASSRPTTEEGSCDFADPLFASVTALASTLDQWGKEPWGVNLTPTCKEPKSGGPSAWIRATHWAQPRSVTSQTTRMSDCCKSLSLKVVCYATIGSSCTDPGYGSDKLFIYKKVIIKIWLLTTEKLITFIKAVINSITPLGLRDTQAGGASKRSNRTRCRKLKNSKLWGSLEVTGAH